MGRPRNRKGLRANPDNDSPAYWNGVLKRAGLGVDAGKLPKGKGPRARKCIFTPARGPQSEPFIGSRPDAKRAARSNRNAA